MIEKTMEAISRILPVSAHTAKLSIYESIDEVDQRKQARSRLLFKVWTCVTALIIIWSCTKWTWAKIIGQKSALDLWPIILMLGLLGVVVSLVGAWRYLHSRYSPVERWKMERLLWQFSENVNLIKPGVSGQVAYIRWEYVTSNDEVTLTLLTGGRVSSDFEEDIARRLVAFLIKETPNYWEIQDKQAGNGVIQICLTHRKDERITINSLDTLRTSEKIDIQLTGRMSLTTKQPMGLIVGPTGTGKTSLLKGLIISFLVNNPSNVVYTIDGKAAFLGQSMKRIGKVAMNAEEAIQLVDELCKIMDQRYKDLNADPNDERDITHCEKFHQGTILLVIDELLSLVANMKAEDQQRKTADKLYQQFNAKLLSLITKGRQSSISVIVAGQMMPASALPTEARSSLGMRISLGRTSPQQAQEVFGESHHDLPLIDAKEFGGLIWLDGLNWDGPKAFLPPKYDEDKLPFKATLTMLAGRRGGGGTPQAATASEDLPVT